MFAQTFLMTALLSQCSGGSCYAPSSYFMPTFSGYSYPYYMASTLPVAQAGTTAPTAKYEWHWISHEGLTFPVWGYKNSNGNITWNPELKANKDSLAKYKALAEKKANEREIGLQSWQIKGVDPSKRAAAGTERLRSSGPMSAEFQERFEASRVKDIEGEQVDDSSKPHVTVIGTTEECERVLKDFKSGGPLHEFADKIHLQAYRHGAWEVKDNGLDQGGTPDVICQMPDGTVKWRQKNYDGGADVLRKGLRRALPDYHSSNDPGPDNQGGSIGSADLYWLTGGAVAVLFIVAAIKPSE